MELISKPDNAGRQFPFLAWCLKSPVPCQVACDSPFRGVGEQPDGEPSPKPLQVSASESVPGETSVENASRCLFFDLCEGGNDVWIQEDKQCHGADQNQEFVDGVTNTVEELWQNMAVASLTLCRQSQWRELSAAPASVRAMVSRARRRRESCSSNSSCISESSAVEIASIASTSSRCRVMIGCGEVGSAEVGDSSSEDEDGEEDVALSSLADALAEIFTDGCGASSRKERTKRQLAAFTRARVEGGGIRAAAVAEGMQVIRKLTEFLSSPQGKEMLSQ
jgi:hypothetical protein